MTKDCHSSAYDDGISMGRITFSTVGVYLEPCSTRVFVVGLLVASGVVWSANRSGLSTEAHFEVKGDDLVGPSRFQVLKRWK